MQTLFHFCQYLYGSSFKLSQQFDVWSITGQSATDFSLLLTRCICVGGAGRGFRETKPFLPVVGFVYSVSSYIHVLLKTKDVTTGMKLLKKLFNVWCYYRSLILQWNPVNTATIGQKKKWSY